MAKQWRVSIDNLRERLDEFVERVLDDDDVVVVELGDHRTVTIAAGEPVDSGWQVGHSMTPEAYAAFVSAAGGWSDVDTDQLIADIYARRKGMHPVGGDPARYAIDADLDI